MRHAESRSREVQKLKPSSDRLLISCSQNIEPNSKVRRWHQLRTLALCRFRPKSTAASFAQTLQTDGARPSHALAGAKSVDLPIGPHQGEEPQRLSPQRAHLCISRYNLGSSMS